MKINFYVGFNNYYNRKVIVHDSLDDYQDYLLLTIPNVNFKPKDGINTEQIVNTTQAVDYQVFNLSNTPDYAVVADDDNTIISRWFVIQYESLIYKNQYRAVLRRDVIADNFDAVVEAPVFIEKATITDKTDPAIFNSENMGFNQIKKGEDLIRDKFGNIAWIVGYIPSNADWSNITTVKGIYNGVVYTYNGTARAGHNAVSGMPFKMFCMPYGSGIFFEDEDPYHPTQFTSDGNISLAIAEALAPTLGSGSVYDIQILPYCPIRDKLAIVDNKVEYTAVTKYDYIYKEGEEGQPDKVKGIVFWCNTNKFTFDITYSLAMPSTALEMKVKNETEMYRLCSPNYNGQFEFNPMKNGGVTKFNVDCMYQPYNPYIHMNPDFGNLYGEDYNDARGLICQGDFSLPEESSAWANYQQNNKNYQNIFDRQIQNMETMNRYDRINALVGIGAGTISGAAGSGLTGGLIGGPIGTVAGATIGGIATVGGGIADYFTLKAQQKETLDYTKDLFGFNNQNIQAMPNSISKTNPFTNNNKIFPVLEYYTCKDKEKQALKDKMTYNGMTIGRIGKISDWLHTEESYIKGKLIMLDSSIEEDYHTVIEIASELDQGIRVKKKEE